MKKKPISSSIKDNPYVYFIANDFHRTLENKNITIEAWLLSIFDNYYWRSFINYSKETRNKFINDTYNIIKFQPDLQFKVAQELDFTEEFKDILECLIEIQNNSLLYTMAARRMSNIITEMKTVINVGK